MNKESTLLLNPHGFNLCKNGEKKASLRLGEISVADKFLIINTDTSESIEVSLKENISMKYKECLENESYLSILGYKNDLKTFKKIMKESYPELVDESVVSLIFWK